MNVKKSLEHRIRGWLPNTPKLPQVQPRTPMLKSVKAVTYPPPLPMPEKKYQRNIGMVFGLGFGILMIGLVGAFNSYTNYNDLLNLLNSNGINPSHLPNTVFRDLLDQTGLYLTLVVLSVGAIIWGVLVLKNRFFREIFQNNRLYTMEGNFLALMGVIFITTSIGTIFRYLLYLNKSALIRNSINLWLPGVFIYIGACLIVAGIAAWSRTK
jgi:hypothetical protein